MIQKTEALVLHSIPFKDSGTISHVYTRQFGRISLMVHGGRKKNKIFYQSLFLTELSLHYHENREMQTLSQFQVLVPYTTIPFDIRKSSVVLFLAEVLYKVLQEEEKNELLFDFIKASLEYFDHAEAASNNFHLSFLIQLTRFLGFYPGDSLHEIFTSEEDSEHFNNLVNPDYDKSAMMRLNGEKRAILLKSILNYYQRHLENFSTPKSLAVLEELFR